MSEPPRFSERWLRFDPQQPTRPGLLKRFVATVFGLLIVCGLLALIIGR